MNSGGQARPPFFNNVPNMIPQPRQPPSPFHPNVPPPNFFVPPPTIPPGGQFPRFSGPMHNQPTFNPSAGGVHNNIVPPALPSMNLLPPVYNVNNNVNNNQGGGNQGSMFNQRIAGQWSNNIVNNTQHTYPTIQQRQMPNLGNDIFSDAPKDIQCGFPHFKPTIPPPLQNSITPSPMPPVMNQRGGMNGRGGGFHQGNNGFHNNANKNNSNNNNYNNNKGNNNNNSYNNYNNNKGRGGFHGGMNNRGRGNFHHKDKGGNNNNNHHDGVQKTKEPKVDKRDLPENNVFYCDTCDRGFKTDDKYTEHVAQHQRCTYKDCPFVAAPKLVQLHMNMQHRQGLASRIYGVKSEEDINKWREERRKNYPTADNIKKKKDKREEMLGRGEVIETKEFGKMRGQNRGRDRGRGRGRDRFGQDRGNSNGVGKEVINVDEDDDGPPEERKIERSNKEDKNELTNGAHSENTSKKVEKKKKEKKSIVDLTTQCPSPTKKSKSDDHCLSLLSGYGSDSDESSGDEDDDVKAAAKTKTKIQKRTVFTNESKEDGGNKFGLISGTKDDSDDDDDSTTNVDPESKSDVVVVDKSLNIKDVCDNTSGITTTTQVKSGTSGVNCAPEVNDIKRSHGNKGGPPNKKSKFTPRPLPKSHTLLEKLLAKEIRRERNKILQCVHFIVKNKFFDETAGD